NLLICLLGVPVVSAAALLLKYVGGPPIASQHHRRLEVRIGAGRDPEPLLSGVFGEQLKRHELASVVSARQGAALDLVYRVELNKPNGMFALVKAIHALDGVQNVELRED
ncbi:MAG TPA: hypothetical protein VL096_17605, partial [Pirellulaceae bacterium]|nr:hypothetical protein [Pirellulaceae bacterium]